MNPHIAELAHTVQVNSEEEYQTAAEVLLQVKEKIKAIEEVRKSFVGPLNATVKTINAFFKEPRTQFEMAEAHLKRAMGAYKAKLEAARQKTLQEAAVQAQAGDAVGFTALMVRAAAQPVAEAPGTHSVVRWKFEVTDEAAVPREFLMVDERKIRAHVTKLKGEARIPGVRVYEETSIVARGR